MLVKQEVELHQNSIDYVKETFAMYEKVKPTSEFIKNPIIHIYPVEDTYDQFGNLNGYSDSLFFKIDVYDTENMVVHKGEKLHDGIIPYKNINISQIKIFKDLSAMIVLNGSYFISTSNQTVNIYEK